MKLFFILTLPALCASDTPAFVASTAKFAPAFRKLDQRKMVIAAGTVTDGQSHEPSTAIDTAASTVAISPVLELPMGRIKLPRLAVGKECVTIPVKIGDHGSFEFMLDTGLTTEMISPNLQSIINPDGKEQHDFLAAVEGLATGGSTGHEKLIYLSGLSLHDEEKGHDLKLPRLESVVTNLAQEKLDRRHPISGMLGMEMLSAFDVDLDFPSGKVRFWEPGTAVNEARRQGMVDIPITVINDSLLLGTRITGKGDTKKTGSTHGKQPFLGIIDTGSPFSAINWKAAKLLGLPPRKSLQYLKPPAIMAVGIDNKPLYVPTAKVEFTFCGDAIANDDGMIVGFASPPAGWKPW